MPPADAHLHLADLEAAAPGSAARLGREAGEGVRRLLASSCHERGEFAATEALRAHGFPFAPTFGIHPQLAVWDEADFLAGLARDGRIAAVGECGFEFFGDRPEWTRTPENERLQRSLFEFQLDVARANGLPLVLHQRRALDLVFAYARELKALPAVVLHSWSGPLREAEALLGRGIKAFFSFGSPILNGNRKARESCAGLPAGALLLETDAPWQPPRGEAVCLPGHIDLVLGGAAALRGEAPEALSETVAANFLAVYGDPARFDSR